MDFSVSQLTSPIRKTGGKYAFLAVAVICIATSVARSQSIEWYRQFGSSASEIPGGVSVDSSGVYMVGSTDDKLPEQPSFGGRDAFIRKYSHAGNHLWTRQFGSFRDDQAFGVTSDGNAVYVSGWTAGELPGGQSLGGTDGFLIKFDTDGNQLWVRHIGIAQNAGSQQMFGVTIRNGVIYIVGIAEDQTIRASSGSYIASFDSEGNPLGSQRIPNPPFNVAYKAGASDQGVFVWGSADGVIGGAVADDGSDFYLRSLSNSLSTLWTRQLGIGFHNIPGIKLTGGLAIDSTGVYVHGTTPISLPGQASAGGNDVFIRKFDFAGNEVWTRQFGTPQDDGSAEIAADDSGVYVVDNLEGIVIKHVLPNGDEDFTFPVRPVPPVGVASMALDGSFIYLSGGASGSVGSNQGAGGTDAVLVKIRKTTPIPTINPGGLVNNASFSRAIAPGSLVALFGSGFLNTGIPITSTFYAQNGKLTTALGGTSASVNGIPTPIFYVTPQQLGIQVPFEVAGQTLIMVRVNVNGIEGPPQTAPLAQFAPGIFTTTQDGSGIVAARHSDGTPVSFASPARAGEIIAVYGTGLGILSPSPATGAPAGNGLNLASSPVSVLVDNMVVSAQFAGGAPGLVGINQVNFQIPSNVHLDTMVPLAISIGGVISNTVSIPIAH